MNAFEAAEFGKKVLDESGAAKMLAEAAAELDGTALGGKVAKVFGAIEERIGKLFGAHAGGEQLSDSLATAGHSSAFLNAELGNRNMALSRSSAEAFAEIRRLEAGPAGFEDPAKAEALTQRARVLFGLTNDPLLLGFPNFKIE